MYKSIVVLMAWCAFSTHQGFSGELLPSSGPRLWQTPDDVTATETKCTDDCWDGIPSNWQMLPRVPGYVPVYIQNGDTPLEEINPELAEAFHAIPSGRSAARADVLAAPDEREDNNVAEEMLADAPLPPNPEEPSSESSESSSKSASYEHETSLFPAEPNESKRPHEKNMKKAGIDNVQKIPANDDKQSLN